LTLFEGAKKLREQHNCPVSKSEQDDYDRISQAVYTDQAQITQSVELEQFSLELTDLLELARQVKG
jgi:hypothetical protein